MYLHLYLQMIYLFKKGKEHAKTLICFEVVQSSPSLTYESKKKLKWFLIMLLSSFRLDNLDCAFMFGDLVSSQEIGQKS